VDRRIVISAIFFCDEVSAIFFCDEVSATAVGHDGPSLKTMGSLRHLKRPAKAHAAFETHCMAMCMINNQLFLVGEIQSA
jgi:hypothetical protein